MNILFDLDGTLTDPYEGITKCIEHALIELDRQSPPRSNLKWCIGPPLKNSFATLLDSVDDYLINEALAKYRERFSTIGLFENKVYAGIPEVLDSLRQMGHSLFVATSKPAVFARQIVDHFGLSHYFTNVYGSELDGRRNDKACLVSYILENELIDSSDAWMVGDREHDMIGATANGVSGFGVLWGFGTKSELESSGASACLAQPEELISLFSGCLGR